MVEYYTVNARLSNSQLNQLESAVKNKQGTTLRMNARMFNGSNLPHELLLTARQTAKLRNAIKNNISTNIKLSEAQISKIIRSDGFFRQNSWFIIKSWIAIIKIIKPLGLLDLTAASSAIDAGVQKMIYGSGTTTLAISSEEMNDIMKIVQL